MGFVVKGTGTRVVELVQIGEDVEIVVDGLAVGVCDGDEKEVVVFGNRVKALGLTVSVEDSVE